MNSNNSNELHKNLMILENLYQNMMHEAHIWEVIRSSDNSIKTWKLVDANKLALDNWNLKLEDIIGKTTDEIFPESNATQEFMPIVEKIFQENKPLAWEKYFSGTNQTLNMISIPLGDIFISTGIDATKQKQTEDYINKATQLNAMGLIAAGVAHDLNNILTMIHGNLEIIKKLSDKNNNKLQSAIGSLVEATLRAGDITQDILDLSGQKETQENCEFCLHKLIKSFEKIIGYSLPTNIELSIITEKEIPNILGDQKKLSRVILNLIKNAIDSLSEDGGYIKINLFERENFVECTISDDGKGMDQETLSKLFNPFFSTKSEQKISGIGMCIVKDIIDSTNGEIYIESKPDQGTTVRLLLPKA